MKTIILASVALLTLSGGVYAAPKAHAPAAEEEKIWAYIWGFRYKGGVLSEPLTYEEIHAEVPDFTAKDFGAADTDHDNKLSPAEYVEYTSAE